MPNKNTDDRMKITHCLCLNVDNEGGKRGLFIFLLTISIGVYVNVHYLRYFSVKTIGKLTRKMPCLDDKMFKIKSEKRNCGR